MKNWTLYNAILGTFTKLTDKEAKEVKKFYKIDFRVWDDYYQTFKENSFHNARGDMYLWRKEVN